MNLVDEDAVYDELHRLITECGTRGAVAKRLGVGLFVITSAANASRPISDELARRLGYEKVTMYRKVDEHAR